MAERLAYLEAVVGADISDFRRGMRDIRNDVGILSSTIGGISGAARTMTFAFTAPMVALGTMAVQAASGFDAAMRNINSIIGLGETQFAGLSSEVLDFAKTTRAGVIPATQALYEVFSAGITDQALAIQIWETSNKVAEGSVGDLTATTNALTATMSAFNLETGDASRVGNVWTRMVQLGVGSLNDFLSNSQKVLPLSAAMNISLEDMGATLAFLSQGGGGAAKAETSYAMMLSNMLKPTKAMETALQGLGVASGKELIEKFGSVGDAVMALKNETGEVDFTKLFSKTGLEAALRITGNFDKMTEASRQFNDSLDTATMDAWNQQSKSFAFQWDLMVTALQGVATVIGQAIIPLITPLITGFTSLLTKVSETNPELVQMGVAFVGILAAAFPIIWLLTSMLTPIGLIAAAAGALAIGFATNFGGIRDTVSKIIPDILGDLQPLGDAVKTFLSVLFPTQNDFSQMNAAAPNIVVDPMDHITVTEPKSLWQIYTENGYADKFSWESFMEAAKAGGWGGGAINVGDDITIEGGIGLGQKLASDFVSGFNGALGTGAGGVGLGDGMNGVSDVVKAGAGGGGLFDRLADAATAAWPKVKAALDGMWTNFTNWVTTTAIPAVDEAGAGIMNSIANWFSSPGSDKSGNSAAYGAVTGLMVGIPNAVNDLSTSFPELTSALSNLFTSIGGWIEKEGMPTLARAAGNVVGQLAVGIGNLLGGVWDAIKPGGSGNAGAGNAVSVINDSFVQPALAGFNDATKGADVAGGLDGFVTGIAGALVTAFGVATFGQMLLGKGLMAAVWGSLTFAFGGGAAGAGAAGAAGAMPAAVGIMGSLKSALMSVALNPITLGLVLGLYVGNMPEVQTFVKGVFNSIFGENAAQDFARDTENIVYDIIGRIAGATGNTELQNTMNGYIQQNSGATNVPSGSTQNGQNIGNSIVSKLPKQGAALPNGLNAASMLGSSNAGGMLFGTAFSAFLQSNKMTVQDVMSPAEQEAMASAMAESFISTGRAIDFAPFGEVVAEGSHLAISTSIAAKSDDLTKNGEDIVAPIAQGVGTKFKSLPMDTDVQGAATGLTDPFIQTFTGAFAPGGTVTAPLMEFTTTFTTQMQTLLATAQATMPALGGIINETMGSLTTVIGVVSDQLTSMGNALNGLSGKHIEFSITSSASSTGTTTAGTTTTAAPMVDATAKSGMNYVPYDGFVAELHKGEAVLTAEQAAAGRIANATPKGGTGGSSDYSTSTFNIYEAHDWESIKREAKRQGYNFDKLK